MTPIGNGHLGISWSRDRWRHVTQKSQGRDPNMLRVQYLDNGWWQRLADNGPPIGNGHLGINWSRGRWRHVTQKGQGRDPICLGPSTSKMAGDSDLVTWSTYRLCGMASQMITWPMTSRDPERCLFFLWSLIPRSHYIWCPLSRKRLEIQTWSQLSTYRKWGMASRMVWCSMSSRVPFFLFGTDYILSLHFHNRQNCLKI